MAVTTADDPTVNAARPHTGIGRYEALSSSGISFIKPTSGAVAASSYSPSIDEATETLAKADALIALLLDIGDSQPLLGTIIVCLHFFFVGSVVFGFFSGRFGLSNSCMNRVG
eukprot:CAMPEP_0195510578 /NCGR_PEP_ID=MMETSP0794_2-20130614/3185_1 /TAXON_ID=515487 /ORGANISM="Stephanopyxis turris, Strain CCMP 815" /LENGTH=112 /DNA_ID=CAMNT_0040638023 /DNA_START=155 /DNA_END=493 /DNA_ORIENTATION=+